ncbi:N-acetylglucosamine-6-phosphate deacetylase [Superficieibacter electus]|uniref:N-acetylglucosamine-6-phosphate deacetylase n=1 Tax=Superficieibacter electus TaxID=2022662 RepID=A0A2P5GRL0_9ENTR|nr:amidohydrolase family protein [Superficieibacter electus]POP45862.1 N-acetylglucosamine-6-phosphate deacetylase [Superficieibacter electus]POP49169.1 N-acetylglucosamine-6-phosphate deacetylase [Superficieibacter electus]
MTDCVLRVRDYRTLRPIAITIAQGCICAIEPLKSSETLPIVAPGLIDLQVNGFQGIDFNHYPFSAGQVEEVVRLLWQQGVTSWLPTVITADQDTISRAMRALAQACEQRPAVAAALPGIHLEGPFLSPQDGPRGAHPLSAICAPDYRLFDEWQRCADGRIRLLTLSAEWPQAAAFIRHYQQSGVQFSIGHTAASPEQIDEAINAGARMSTHLGNGAHLQLPRHPNYIWQQLADDRLACTVIADGEHLPVAVLKVFMRAKGQQIMLVSDVTHFAGRAPGEYQASIGGHVILHPNGRLAMRDNPQLLAGSARSLLDGVNFLLSSALADLPTAIEMASIRPARQLNLPQQAGLAVGAPADLITFVERSDRGVQLIQCWKEGQKVWGD